MLSLNLIQMKTECFGSTQRDNTSPRTAAQIMNQISESYRLLHLSDQCMERLSQETQAEDYCTNLVRTSCNSDPNPRIDRTGGVILPTSENPTAGRPGRITADSNFSERLNNEIFNSTTSDLREYIGTRIRNGVNTNRNFFLRPFLNKSLSNEELRQCSERLIQIFVRFNRSQFFTSSSEYNYQRVDFSTMTRENVNQFLTPKCSLESQAAVAEFITSESTRNFRQEIDNRLINAFRESPAFQKIQNEIFPNMRRSAIDLIRRSNNINPEARKEELIRRINNTRISPCEDGTLSPMGLTAESAIDTNGSENLINICPRTLLNCQSEFCLSRLVAHELSHTFDACAFSDSNFNPNQNYSNFSSAARAHPLGHLYSCVRNILGPNSISGGNICESGHLREGFCDFAAYSIMSHHFQNYDVRSFNEHDYRRGFANALVCSHGVNVVSSDWRRYPSSRQRIQITMRHPGVRSLMNCGNNEENRQCNF